MFISFKMPQVKKVVEKKKAKMLAQKARAQREAAEEAAAMGVPMDAPSGMKFNYYL
jgi:hypothetical protein